MTTQTARTGFGQNKMISSQPESRLTTVMFETDHEALVAFLNDTHNTMRVTIMTIHQRSRGKGLNGDPTAALLTSRDPTPTLFASRERVNTPVFEERVSFRTCRETPFFSTCREISIFLPFIERLKNPIPPVHGGVRGGNGGSQHPRSFAQAGRIEHQVAGVGGHEETTGDCFGSGLNNIQFLPCEASLPKS